MGMSRYMQELRSKVGDQLLMLPSVAAVILNDKNELLLQEKVDGSWSLPAGMIEPGETPTQALVREVAEETGLAVEPVKILALMGGKAFRFTYPNGHQVEYMGPLFLCRVTGKSELPRDNETVSLQYFSQDSLPELAVPHPKAVLFNELPETLML